MATLNTRGFKQLGKREEIEAWVKTQDIDILAIQETHISCDQQERRANYTWYMSGTKRLRNEGQCEAGVGFVIKNNILQYVIDIEPVNDRICRLELNYIAPISLICIYTPQAYRPSEEKETVYKILGQEI